MKGNGLGQLELAIEADEYFRDIVDLLTNAPSIS
jgi:hypothetical protein